MVCLAAGYLGVPLGGPQAGGPHTAQPTLSAAQFLFLVPRRSDEGASRQLALCAPSDRSFPRFPSPSVVCSRQRTEGCVHPPCPLPTGLLCMLGSLRCSHLGRSHLGPLVHERPDCPHCREPGGEVEPLQALKSQLKGVRKACGSHFLAAQKLEICVGPCCLEDFLEGGEGPMKIKKHVRGTMGTEVLS